MGIVTSSPAPLAFPNADLIIRTSDKKEFKVHKNIMAMISEVFKDMMSLDDINPPRPPLGNSKPDLPVVDITESSPVISNLLKLIYHSPPPNSITLDDMLHLFHTMHKYQGAFGCARIQTGPQVIGLDDTVQDLFLANIDAKKTPMRLYAIAKKYSLNRISDSLLPAIVILDLRSLSNQSMSREIDFLPFREYHKLIFFAKQRASLILKAIESATL
ncbi:hypothetical protein SISSUDRAFT_1060430 [Sistotremastrum suecicum HHB10207 ss-3]|uniref:BTB domain-containing protein n=1 Tax=Sistotremastrum suecicum HHB10207 ss-3 TaxID=1314776 RepID=A0A166F2S3_9AGAM|nr:hypothetical protein SISSUDRAFT_1060430 [Sistotremastrum suecicum HHB10207 ss-3]